MCSPRSKVYTLIVFFMCFSANISLAQTTPAGPDANVSGSLVDLINSGQYNFNALERVAAVANQASYNSLTSNPSGPLYCNPQQTTASAPGGSCPTTVFLVFEQLRSLVQSANFLLKNGQPTTYSYNLPNAALGRTLRWTAAEELSAPGSAAAQFANGQFANVANRLSALRFGASGFQVNGLMPQGEGGSGLAWNAPATVGGGASGDDNGIGIASRWGGFLNGSYGWGRRSPSALEDAFTFFSRDVTLGIDYRFTRHFILGASMGYESQNINFQFIPLQSIVGGYFRSHGLGGQLYGLYEWDGPYVSASVGVQRMNYSSSRLIKYVSNNLPSVPGVNSTATGSTQSTSLTATFNVGWPLVHGAFQFEPYLNNQYERINLDGFSETSIDNNTGQQSGFGFTYSPQTIKSLDSALGTRFQYTLQPPFGVVIPFISAEYHHRFIAPTSAVVSAYNPIAGDGASFNIPSDAVNSNYYQFAGGASMVFGHGVQAFIRYQTTARVDYVSSHLIAAGVRGEF